MGSEKLRAPPPSTVRDAKAWTNEGGRWENDRCSTDATAGVRADEGGWRWPLLGDGKLVGGEVGGGISLEVMVGENVCAGEEDGFGGLSDVGRDEWLSHGATSSRVADVGGGSIDPDALDDSHPADDGEDDDAGDDRDAELEVKDGAEGVGDFMGDGEGSPLVWVGRGGRWSGVSSEREGEFERASLCGGPEGYERPPKGYMSAIAPCGPGGRATVEGGGAGSV